VVPLKYGLIATRFAQSAVTKPAQGDVTTGGIDYCPPERQTARQLSKESC
jgi:hypothetical protein